MQETEQNTAIDPKELELIDRASPLIIQLVHDNSEQQLKQGDSLISISKNVIAAHVAVCALVLAYGSDFENLTAIIAILLSKSIQGIIAGAISHGVFFLLQDSTRRRVGDENATMIGRILRQPDIVPVKDSSRSLWGERLSIFVGAGVLSYSFIEFLLQLQRIRNLFYRKYVFSKNVCRKK